MDTAPIPQDPAAAASRASATPAPLIRIFHRIFSRHVMNTALLLLIVVLMSRTMRMPKELLSDPDLWWHLADARILSETHHFIHVEPYSFTVACQPWVNPEWLGEMPYWFGYRVFGLTGIFLITGLALFANLIFVYWRGYWISHHAGAAFWAAGIGFMLMTVNAGARIIVIAYLCLSAEMAILEAAERGKTRLLWFLPPLFCLWINLHGSWLIGLSLLVLYILCGLFTVKAGVFEQQAFSPTDRNRLLQVLAASVAALFVNPYGWLLLYNPVDMMMNQRLSHATVQEWHPLNLSSLPGMGALAVIFLTIIANALCSRKWRIYEMAFVLFAWYAAFAHTRFAFLAAILTVPMLAGDLKRTFFLEPDTKTIPIMNLLMVAGSLCLIVFVAPSPARLKASLSAVFPLQTIAAIQPSWRTFNSDALGGIMNFESKPTFVDSRFDTFDHHGVLKDYIDIMLLSDSLNLLDKYKVDHVLLPQDMSLSYLLERTPGWIVLKREGTANDAFELFAKTPGAPATAVPGASAPAAGQHEAVPVAP